MPPLTVSAAIGRYLRHRERTDLDPRSVGRFDEMARAVRRCYGTKPASQFRGPQLKRVRDYLLARRHRFTGEPLSRVYINQLISSAVQCWRWLLSEGKVGAAGVAQLQAVQPLGFGQGGREPTRVMPPAPGWDRVLHFLTSTVRAMVIVQVCGGMRPQDVCRMTRKELSTRKGEPVELPGTGRFVEWIIVGRVPVWLYVPSKHKTSHKGKPRAVPLGPRAQAVLAPLIEGLKPDGLVFNLTNHLRECGKPNQYSGRTQFEVGVYAQFVARSIARANAPLIAGGMPPERLIPHWTPHQLRHLQATAVGDALDREHARALLGHSGGGDMIDRYMEQQLGKAVRAAAECG